MSLDFLKISFLNIGECKIHVKWMKGECELCFFRHLWGVCERNTHREGDGVGRSRGCLNSQGGQGSDTI